ncbi:hypothetical protein BD770DRAFT_440130 [Pilaira anomala]|nr:hypothetical protein BD770DRAFT_440130 [Pilaira anomala]
MPVSFSLTPFTRLPNCDRYEYTIRDACEFSRTKIIVLRIYFVLIILNLLFVVVTTGYFIHRFRSHLNYPPDLNSITNQNISRLWRIYSLKKRSVFGSVLGAIGHLVFVTSVLFYQVIVTTFTCDIFLWGPMIGFMMLMYSIIWRARRLHLLIKINELKQRYRLHNSTQGIHRLSATDKQLDSFIQRGDKDYKWAKRYKDVLNISKRRKFYGSAICAIISILILVIVPVEYFVIWADNHTHCEYYIGNYIILSLVGVYFVVIVPFVIWYLRKDEDAHGLRKEIWIAVAVGIPCSIVCIIWQSVFEYPSYGKHVRERMFFGSSNWLIILTTTNHVTSIVLPMFKTLKLEGPNGNRTSKEGVCRKVWLRKMFYKQTRNSTVELVHLTASGGHNWELTMESLARALSDLEQLAILKSWAVKDFTVENILFFEEYRRLINDVKEDNFRESKSLEEEQEEEAVESLNRIETVRTAQSSTLFPQDEDFLNIPLKPEHVLQAIDFYLTFLEESAPLQVNISYKTKKEIEKIMEPISRSPNSSSKPTTPIIPDFLQSPVTSPRSETSITATKCITYSTFSQASTIVSRTEDVCELQGHHLTLRVFEQARKEVFWNIFSGLFPKVVEASNSHVCD